MKKSLSWILLLALCVLMFAGCSVGSQSENSCEHSYTATVKREPTYDMEGETEFVCSQCGHTYTESVEKLVRHVVSQSVLATALSGAKYRYSQFSVSVGKLMNYAMDGYNVNYLTGEEAIKQGYLSKSNLADDVDIHYLYYAVVSGDTMINPDLPYLTEYETGAIKVWMIFDDNDQLLNSGVTVSSRLHTCAVLMMSNGY